MKVKNIMFSGFAAALFATMGGAASAADADVKLITKDYADENLQGKLTEGNNIVIDEQNRISASFALGENEDGTAVTIEQALAAKADASAVESLEGLVGEKSVAEQITDKVGEIDGTVAAALDTKLTAKSITGDGVSYDELTSVYTITDENTTYTSGTNVTIDGTTINVPANGEIAEGNTGLVTGGTVYATTNALGQRVTAVEGNIGTVPEEGWTIGANEAKTIAEAVGFLNSKTASSEDVTGLMNTVGDSTKGLVKQVNDLETNKQNKLTSANFVAGDNATVTIAEDGKITISAIDTKYETGTADTSGLTKLYGETGENTNGTMTQAAITTALSGKLASNGTAEKATADAAGNVITDTYATQETVNTKVTGIKTAGTYLVNFDATGNASYAPIQILGSNGEPIDLTTGAVMQ